MAPRSAELSIDGQITAFFSMLIACFEFHELPTGKSLSLCFATASAFATVIAGFLAMDEARINNERRPHQE
ncbi:hypothetical protein L5515_005373 [Caenorhabditis briggsae]|uniref:Uncharacterized protein n=1 Tax=Caenorhabditis briggsae TaxID=6238 RepID=A0AAE9EP46_CAEBR|nr:hypothetical protein L5515_005373 [Caenorhabditis briggsae]